MKEERLKDEGGQGIEHGAGISPLQLKKIWATARELGWDSARLHLHVETTMGLGSLRALSRNQAKRLIDELGRWTRSGGKPPMNADGRGGDRRGYREKGMFVGEGGAVGYYASPAQIAKMTAIAGRIGWGQNWICRVATRVLGKPVRSLVSLKSGEAMKLINVVEGFVSKREQEQKQKSLFGAEGGNPPMDADGRR